MKTQMSDSKHLNLPDLAFFQWCHSHFGVNKGVYNTIDTWLYEIGIEEIHERRTLIESFLRYVKSENVESIKHQFLRFGNGGLTRKLYEFFERNKTTKDIIRIS